VTVGQLMAALSEYPAEYFVTSEVYGERANILNVFKYTDLPECTLGLDPVQVSEIMSDYAEDHRSYARDDEL